MPASNQFEAAKAKSNRSINRLIALILVVVLGFCALCASILREARKEAWERAAEAATSLVSAIESDVARNMESADLSLQNVIDYLNDPQIAKLDLQTRRKVLFNRSVPVSRLGSVLVIDEDGNVTLDSRTADAPPLKVADRDYFQVHKDNPSAGLYVSRPIISRISGLGIFGVSRRLSRPDGSFAGVVMVSVQLSYFHQLFQQSVLGSNGAITLSTADGVMLMHWPYHTKFIGSDFRHSKLYDEFAKARAGRFEERSSFDGVERLHVYSQIGQFPLLIAVGQSTGDVFAAWRRQAKGFAGLMALLTAVILALAAYLIGELRKRRDAEADLAVLAMTDSLTKLANRRHFNEHLKEEWERAVRDGTPLCLIMFDADKFKPYNDLFGHQAGDELLKAIGGAIAVSTRLNDLGVRYGGDEFALLLPRTSIETANDIGRAIRREFILSCQRQGVVPTGLSTGIACVTPQSGSTESELIEAADRALYDAKRHGKNRTETTPDAAAATAPPSPTEMPAAEPRSSAA
jgi:diguanylate cyclase (GGDEF)-like protein